MLDFFKRKVWKPETLPELSGAFGGISITVSNLPFRVEELSGKRTYAYDDFGFEFITELHDRLGDFEQLRQSLPAIGSKKVLVKLRDLQSFEVEITGSIPSKQAQFYSDIADALINAFDSQGIKR